MNIKYVIVGATAAAMLLAGVGAVALADTTVQGSAQVTMGMDTHPAMVLNVNANGKVLLRGTIDTVGTNSITVKSWGGSWTVNTASGTQVFPEGSLSQFAAGDFVGVRGTVNQSASLTIDATMVRDWTVRGTIKTNQQDIKNIIKSLSPRNWQGTASNLSANSFTLTVDGTAYTVNLAANAEVVNKVFVKLPFADIKQGDMVRVWGPLSGTTITASVVRKISL